MEPKLSERSPNYLENLTKLEIDVARIQVHKIDPNGKYVFVVPPGISDEMATGFGDALAEWWELGGHPFVVFGSGMKLIKLKGGPSWLQRLLATLRLKKS